MPGVVVVGAGVVGARGAWQLWRLGARALLLEREPEPGKGSTGRATGGFRAQYGTDVNVRLSLLSREKLRRFIEDTGVDPGYDPRGYLWLARTEAQLDVLRGAQDVQRAAGLVEASMLSLRQIREVNPYIRTDGLAGMPMTVWVEDAFHVRARDGRVLLVWPTPGDSRDPESTAVEPGWLEQVREKAAERVPALAGIPVDPARSWAGLYEMSPDQHALLGRAPECDNLYLCNGSSGHGVMHSPALGQLLAEIIVHGQSRSLDVEALRPSRFAEGRPNRAPQIL